MSSHHGFLNRLSEMITAQMPDIQKKAEKKWKGLYKNSPNILLCGKTGVGKSTLINKFFRGEIAKTGIGKPVTKEIKKYHKENVPVNIYDTPGFELGNNSGKKNIMKYIKKFTKDQNPRNNMHIMWYCISGPGSRIEKDEINFLNEIKKKTDLPIILLITKTDQDSEESTKLYNIIKSKNLPISNILQVSAKKNRNVKELVPMTRPLIPDAFRKAFINAQIVNIDEKEKASYKWMKGYIASSALVSFSPIPFSAWIAIVPIQLSMLVHISIIFGLDIDKVILQSLVTGSFAGTGATFLGRFLAGLVKFIPGIGTFIGGTIDAAIAGSITTAIGTSYIKLLGKTMKGKIKGVEVSLDEMKNMIKGEYKKSA